MVAAGAVPGACNWGDTPMGRKPPTEEQKAKAAERRERFRALAKQVAELPDAERARLSAELVAVVTVEGHPLSFANTMLACFQRPGVTIVGGFAQWLKAGRAVRKGETGIGIWVPISGKRKADRPEPAAPADTDGNGDDGRPRFMMGTVFDVSQTDPRAD
jgi:hypothetical protein